MLLQPSFAIDFVRRLPWPVPAVLAWLAGWVAWQLARAAGAHGGAAVAAGVAASMLLAACCTGRWRRLIAAAGYPLSALALMAAADALPPWLWLVLLLPVLLAYPLRAWRDAPFFPTPRHALRGLDRVVAVAPQRVLDAGCGLGHGLAALHRLWPLAELQGLEWSPVLALLARWKCRHARVWRGDMWAASWCGQDLVYVFQRPESMARAFEKARRELAPAAWLVSLEFAVPGQQPWACVQAPGRRPLWVYRPAALAAPAAAHAAAAAPRSTDGASGR